MRSEIRFAPGALAAAALAIAMLVAAPRSALANRIGPEVGPHPVTFTPLSPGRFPGPEPWWGYLPTRDPDVDPVRDGVLFRGWGITLGGGVAGFTDSSTASLTGSAAAYEGRLTLGTTSVIAFEAAYVGTAQSLDVPGLGSGAYLLSNGGEGNVRVNLARLFSDGGGIGLCGVELDPFVTGGGGLVWYSVEGSPTEGSGLAQSDRIGTIPMGGGLAALVGSTVWDVRVTWRAATAEDLAENAVVAGPGGIDLSTWSFTGRAGVSF